jgi:glyoxylase-like metal-dependent hydrolase (beta-lactamase superfamily II)
VTLEDDFCDIIKKARMGQGLSVEQVAGASGISTDALARLERGGRPPTREEAAAVAAALGLRAAPLAEIAAGAWTPPPVPPSLPVGSGGVETVRSDIGGYEVKGYVLHEGGDAVLIDTAANAPAMLERLSSRGLRLAGICLTHGHADHAGGLDRILAQWRVPVYLGEEDLDLMPASPPRALVHLLTAGDDGLTIAVGRLTLRCLITPGHTPGGLCYLVEADGTACCFVGDTLFAGSVGRANPFALYPTHLRSVRERLLRLPPRTVLLPGHGPATTVEAEAAHNPFAASP